MKEKKYQTFNSFRKKTLLLPRFKNKTFSTMEENKKTLMENIMTIKPAFWLASFMELMERWAWYGLFGVFSLYLVASTDEGGAWL